jgi:hypothetical protein
MTATLLVSACFWLIVADVSKAVGLVAAGWVFLVLGVISLLAGVVSLLIEERNDYR